MTKVKLQDSAEGVARARLATRKETKTTTVDDLRARQRALRDERARIMLTKAAGPSDRI